MKLENHKNVINKKGALQRHRANGMTTDIVSLTAMKSGDVQTPFARFITAMMRKTFSMFTKRRGYPNGLIA